MPGLTSVGGILALLDEEEQELKVFALTKLLSLVDDFWAEIANAIEKIEELFEDESFPQRHKAALLASHVFYNLGEMDDALQFALNAGAEFDIDSDSLFSTTVTGWALDKYITLRQENNAEGISTELETVANRLFDRCLHDGTYEQVVGLALESHRIDLIPRAIAATDDKAGLLAYCFKMTVEFVSNRTFKDRVLGTLAALYQEEEKVNYFNLYQCLVAVDNSAAIADSLFSLAKDPEEKDKLALAYQLAFFLEQSVSQQLLQSLIASLKGKEEASTEGEKVDTSRLRSILNGEVSLPLYVNFLSKNNRTDLLLLNQTKKDLNPSSSMQDNAIVIAHALMSAGTTNHAFLRENEDLLKHFSNFAKFTAVASLGVIHKGHLAAAQTVLEPYLPSEQNSNEYENGGALYALGLIYANSGASQIDYLLQKLSEIMTETVRHGCALGLGLAAMGTAREDVYEQLKDVLMTDSAVAGEACGIALGLNMLGTINPEVLDMMINYGTDTNHEKTIRGISIGMALMLFERLEQADPFINVLIKDKDPILRASGCHGIAMAYAGTNNSQVIKRLLHIAVSDANDDVRRAAATGLGFLYLRDPEKLPNVLSLLCESFNPHVRAGCVMALGIACAGSGNLDAIALIEPMLKDRVRYVRQASLVGMALVLIQQKNSHPKIAQFRKTLQEVIKNKHEVSMVRFGATLAQSIVEAGGRNVTVELVSDGGHLNGPAIAGMLVFTQFWFWYPFSLFLSLSFKPTALICLNTNLDMPQIEFCSNAPPSTYTYPKMMEAPKEKDKKKVATAVLSISSKKRARRALSSLGDFEAVEKKKEEEAASAKKDSDAQGDKKKKKKEAGATGGDGDNDDDDAFDGDAKEKMDTAEDSEGNDGKKTSGDGKKGRKVKIQEPSFAMLSNPARVVKEQMKVISIPEECRYQPVTELRGNVLVLRDTTPGEEEALIEVSKNEAVEMAPSGGEVDPPPPFEFDESVDE